MVLKMNCMTRFCVLTAFLVAATEAVALRRSELEYQMFPALRKFMEIKRNPISLPANAPLVDSGGHLATPSQKVFLSKDQSGNYKMTLAQARKHCEDKGTSLATHKDLMTAYIQGYEICNCGWADDGSAYIVMQNPADGCMMSIGVIKCTWQSTWNAFCKETERNPISLPANASLVASGGKLATASQKVIYYSTNYKLGYYDARAYCESKGTSIATFDDLKAALHDGYQKCGCGWVSNGIAYYVMQEAKDDCRSSIGVGKCSEESKSDVFCKYPIPVFLSKDQSDNYKMTLAQARKHCEDKGTSLATVEDLMTAYSLGYEVCSCGWADEGSAYVVMQNPAVGCMMSIGVIKCDWQSTWNAFCKLKA